MVNYEYVKEPGILLDALFLLKLRFNGEGAYSKFREEPGFDEYEEKYCELMKSKVDNISDRLLPLFYYDAGNDLKTPLVWYMRDNWQLLMKKPAEMIDRFMDLIRDISKLKEYIFFHYFPQKAVSAFKGMEYIRETILASEYPLDLKLYLLDFFIASEKEVTFLINEFNKAVDIAKQTWEENSIYINEQLQQDNTLNIEAASKRLNVQSQQYTVFYYTYCCIIRKTIAIETVETESALLYIGIASQYYNNILVSDMQINFYEVGRCLYDETRLKILSMLRNHEMYCAEIARELGLKSNSTIYHLNMLQGQRILKTRVQGKKVYYRISPDFLIALENFLKPIIEEESVYENELEKAESRNHKR